MAAAEKGATVAGDRGKGAAAEKEVTGGKIITLVSNGGEGRRFEVSEAAAARLSSPLRGMIKGGSTGGDIRLPDVDDATLEKVAEYLNEHAKVDTRYTAASEGLEKWGAKLVDGLGSLDALYDLINAADYLRIDGLLDAACKKLAGMMKGKTPEEIRNTFNIPDDYTEEEKKKVRRDYAWAFFIPKDPDEDEDSDEEEEGEP
jgi:S-phase kinase-associated protein 1